VLFQANPFPECDCEAQAIILMSYIAFSIIFLVILMVLMMYFYKKVRRLLPIIVIFLFSIIIGIYSISIVGLPFTPWFQLFFILFQSVIFYMSIEEGITF